MPQQFPHLHIVLLADDYGARLWPLAREQAPACFAPVEPGSSTTLLSATIERVRGFSEYPVSIVTAPELADVMSSELAARAAVSSNDYELLVEPDRRGGAFAVALATARIRRRDPQAIVAVIPTDQRTDDDERWEHIMYRAYQVALRDRIALIGARQERRCHGDSFIRPGRSFENIEGTFSVRRFVPEATPAAARRAVTEGGLWYTGIFLARAVVILGELSNAGELAQSPDTQSSHRIAETANFLAMLEPELWQREDAREVVSILPPISIERAALEHSDRLVAVPVTVNFSTISDLSDLDSMVERDGSGNRVMGEGMLVDSRGSTLYVQEGGRSIVAFGLRDTLIVDSGDAVLVAAKDRLRDTDDLLGALRGAHDPRLHTAGRRPFSWGTATLLDHGETHATWRLDLTASAVFTPFTVPSAFGLCIGDAAENYAVASGSLVMSGRDGVKHLLKAGDCFTPEAVLRPSVAVSETEGASLILTAVLR